MLSQTFGNNPEKMRKYAFLFLDSANDGIAEVNEALGRADLVRAGELGHRIKSSAKAVGAMSFAALCLQLEQQGPQGTVDEARALVAQMVALHQRLTEHIAQEMAASAFG